MQFKSATFFTLAVATLAAAFPTKRDDAPHDQCNTGAMQCCNSVQPASSPTAIGLLALVGAAVGDIKGSVGITCSPISAIGIAGNSCTSQPVCCSNNSFNGVVAIGCTPINVNL